MDMEPRLLLERERLSRDLALALAWSGFVCPTAVVVLPAWAIWEEPDRTTMVVANDPLRPESAERVRVTNAALRELGYKTTAPLSAWKQMGMNVFPNEISSHARLQAVAFFRSKGLAPGEPQ